MKPMHFTLWTNVAHTNFDVRLGCPGSQVLQLKCHLSCLNNSSQTNHLSDKGGGEDYVTYEKNVHGP